MNDGLDRCGSDVWAQLVVGSLNRRSFLTHASTIAAGLIVFNTFAEPGLAIPEHITQKELIKIASFLTGKPDLADEFAKRAYDALVADLPDYPQRLRILMDKISAARLKDVDAFRVSPIGTDGDLMTTATALIGALYTGRVGNDYSGRFIAYREALMYRPTANETPIPTYAPMVLGYWAQPVKDR